MQAPLTTTTTTILPKGHSASRRHGNPLGEGFFPHLVKGKRPSKELPVLPMASSPAQCRKDSTYAWSSDDRCNHVRVQGGSDEKNRSQAGITQQSFHRGTQSWVAPAFQSQGLSPRWPQEGNKRATRGSSEGPRRSPAQGKPYAVRTHDSGMR